jgi:hypothetical protein
MKTMYNSPKHNVTDSLGKMVRKYDKSRTTLINDEVRYTRGFLERERIG